MTEGSAGLAALSYGIAVAGYSAFAARLAMGWRANLRGSIVLAAVALGACWSAATLGAAVWESAPLWVGAAVLDVLRSGAWFAFVLSVLYRPDLRAGAVPTHAGRPPRAAAWLVGGFVLFWAVAQALLAVAPDRLDELGRVAYALPLFGSILGLVLAEQLFRNVPAHARWSFKPLCIGLAGTFCFDVFLFAEAFLFSRIDLDLWLARGFVNFLLIPFVAVSAARNREWSFDIAVSRHVVFHSAALLASGAYLLLLAAAGYYLRYFGGSWGRALQAALLFAGLLFLAVLAFSGSLRSTLRVLMNKHFFSYRYDYRQEWLRFTQSLSSKDPHLSIRELSIKALADLVESPAGYLWLRDASGGYAFAARWNLPEQRRLLPADDGLVRFLGDTEWVLNLDELRESPARYELSSVPDWIDAIDDAWLVVPLMSATELVGFILLTHPRAKIDVNWEVNDLLKTAGRQAASYLGHVQAAEALLEARKFDAFNRMSAFVVHDIKNLVSQLSLLLKNAERHMDNAEFRQDMLLTIANVLERMRNLLLQLRAGTTPIEKPRPVSLEQVVRRVQQSKKGQTPVLETDLEGSLFSMGHEERLERVIGHLVQNALDATDEHGRVWVRLWRANSHARMEIGDTGKGMSAEFIRERLFKPFQSTKAAGMGIGAYESAQYIGELGGEISVESRPDEGTRVRLSLPLVPGDAMRNDNDREVA